MKKDVVALKANYKITKVSNDILASIYCELKKMSLIGNHSRVLQKIENKDSEVINFLTKSLRTYKGNFKHLISTQEGHNLIPLAIRESLATLISGTTVTPTFKANYLALGTDATVATAADTQLGSEFIRGAFSNRYSVSNVAYLDKFWGTSEVGGQDFKEIGTFVDGSATANSGFLLSKININESISATETLTVNVSITVTG